MITRCPHCGKALKGNDSLVGRQVRCPACSQTFTVAEDQATPQQPFGQVAPPPVPPGRATTTCPYCREEIAIGAQKCKHCGEWLTGDRLSSSEVALSHGSWFDKQLVPMHGCLMAVLLFLLPGLACILGLLGLIMCRTSKGRQKSLILFLVGGVLTLVGVLALVGSLASNA